MKCAVRRATLDSVKQMMRSTRAERDQGAGDSAAAGWWLGIVVGLGLLLSCTCEPRSAPKVEEKTLPPLVDGGTPSDVPAEVYPAVGAISPRPVLLVFAAHPEPCALARKRQPRDLHVLCAQQDGPPGQVPAAPDLEGSMKKALGFLKEKYPRHVAGSPALLFCDETSSTFCFQLMLREPAVFAHAYLPGLSAAHLTATTLYTLFSGGAKTLVLSAPLPPHHAPLLAMAQRGGLALLVAGVSASANAEALELLRQQDSRLSPAPPRGPR